MPIAKLVWLTSVLGRSTDTSMSVQPRLLIWRAARFTLLIVFGLYLASLTARLFWLLMTPAPVFDGGGFQQTQAVNNHLAASALQRHAVSEALDIAELSQLPVFGRIASKALQPKPLLVPGIGPEDEATDTRLKLTLSGVIGSSLAQDARAIIVDGRHQGLYGPEQAIERQSGVKLVKVLSDRVILDNNGRYESLWLYCDEPLPRKAATASGSHCGRDSVAHASTPKQNREKLSNTATPQLDKNANVSLSATEATTFDQLIKFSLARKGGEVIGYKIRATQNAALFSRMGLKNSDIVTSVNGVALDSTAKAMEVYQMLRGASSAELELMRDNASMHLSVDVNRRES